LDGRIQAIRPMSRTGLSLVNCRWNNSKRSSKWTTVISDPLRSPVTAQRQADGRIIVRTPGRALMILSVDEIDRLARFASHKATLQRFQMASDSRQNDERRRPINAAVSP
jgi:hypothetical protein